MMLIENDYLDMIICLNTVKCKYLIVGGFALAFNGYVRNTGDIDILVEPTKDLMDYEELKKL